MYTNSDGSKTVQYTAVDTSSANTFSWSFEGGEIINNEDGPSPVVYYENPGAFGVGLVIEDEVGNLTSFEFDSLMIVEQNPRIEVSKSYVEIGEEISISLDDPNISAITWLFDGAEPSISEEMNPTIKYAMAGTFDFVMIVTIDSVQYQYTYEDEMYVSGSDSYSYITLSNYYPAKNESVEISADIDDDIVSVFWYFEGANISTSEELNLEIKWPYPGEYKVTMITITESGEMAASEEIIEVYESDEFPADDTDDDPTFVDDVESDQVYIYPIPVKENLNIYLDNIKEQVKLTLYNVNGDRLFEKGFKNINTMKLPITLAPGIYYCTIEFQEGVIQKAIVVN